MKKQNLIIIIVILLVLGGLLVYYNTTHSNTISINDKQLELASNYSVVSSTKNDIVISNNNTTLEIYPTKYSTNIDKEISNYQKKFADSYEINKVNLNVNDSDLKIVKTIAKSYDKNNTITKYWFVKDNTTYTIQSKNSNNDTDNDVLYMIKSMN